MAGDEVVAGADVAAVDDEAGALDDFAEDEPPPHPAANTARDATPSASMSGRLTEVSMVVIKVPFSRVVMGRPRGALAQRRGRA